MAFDAEDLVIDAIKTMSDRTTTLVKDHAALNARVNMMVWFMGLFVTPVLSGLIGFAFYVLRNVVTRG